MQVQVITDFLLPEERATLKEKGLEDITNRIRDEFIQYFNDDTKEEILKKYEGWLLSTRLSFEDYYATMTEDFKSIYITIHRQRLMPVT